MVIFQNLRSKLLDGLFPAVVVFLILIAGQMIVSPIHTLWGEPGVMVLALVLLALSVFCLDAALSVIVSEKNRAWYGIMGGTTLWITISVLKQMGPTVLGETNSIFVLLVLLLVGAVLWRRVLPIGARFFFAVFVAQWIGFFLPQAQRILTATWAVVGSFSLGILLIACVGVLGTLVWLFGYTEHPIRRMWTSVWLAGFIKLIILFIGGSIF